MQGFTIPGYTRYKITPDGNVFNCESNTWLQGSTNPDGYVNYRLTDDFGNTMTFGRHRLVAMVNFGLPNEGQIVNHKNGIKGDDRVDNLEWTTYQGNIEHAGELGLTEKCIPISTRNPVTNEINHYPSAISVSRELGISKDAVLWRINNGEERVYPEGLQYRKRDDSRPWVDQINNQYGRNRSVLLRNVHTNEIISFEKQQDLAKYLGLSDAAVSVRLSNNDQSLIKGCFQIKFQNDFSPWRIVDDPLRESKVKRSVVVIDENNQKITFASARECAEAMRLKPSTLSERLKSNGEKIFSDGKRYRYY